MRVVVMMDAKVGNELFDYLKRKIGLNDDVLHVINDDVRNNIWLNLRNVIGSSLINGLQYSIWYNLTGIQSNDEGNDDA
jgi:hypothetical protein